VRIAGPYQKNRDINPASTDSQWLICERVSDKNKMRGFKNGSTCTLMRGLIRDNKLYNCAASLNTKYILQ